jgi:hypothetical protein
LTVLSTVVLPEEFENVGGLTQRAMVLFPGHRYWNPMVTQSARREETIVLPATQVVWER